jgi:outer membrane lipoprotein carrier protein
MVHYIPFSPFRIKCTVVLCCCILFSVFSTIRSFASEFENNITRIQKAYDGIKDLKGSFVQKSTIRDLNKTDSYKGEFFIKPPLKMKWIYSGKAAQDMTINNDTVLLFNRAENQAFKGKFDRSTYGQTPVALLSGFGNIQKEFTMLGNGNSIVLKPKKPMGNITWIRIVVSESEFPIKSFTINDSYSNVIEIELKDVRVNTGLKDSFFDLSIPKGANVFEQ